MRDWLEAAADNHPRRLALRRANGASLSYRALSRRVAVLASQFEAAGVLPGDRIAWLGAAARHGILVQWAIARLGAVFLPLNTRLTTGELLDLLALGDAKALLCDRSVEAQVAPLSAVLPVYSLDAPRAPGVQPLPEKSSDNLWLWRSSEFALPAVQSVVFTSGTTGTPKGAQITWFNQYTSAQASAQRIGASAEDRWLLTLPLYHVGGMTIPFRAALSGAAVVEYDSRGGFDPARLSAMLHGQQITHVSLVPAMLHRLLDAGFAGTPYLRWLLLGGAAAPPDLLERAFERGLPVAPTYGLTEACSQVATLPPADAPNRPGSVGKPLGGTTVTIVRDDGASAPAGEVGEIVVRGPTVFAGYLNVPNDRALRNGALYTGDLGFLGDDGYLFVVQRRTDLIVTGGENVYPAEVEAVLRAHPLASDACVVGLPHPEWGQQVAAVLVLKPGAVFDEGEFEAWCRQRLAGYKVPRQLRVVSHLPMTASGKVIRREVAAWFSPP